MELWVQVSIPAVLRAVGIVRVTEWGPLHAGFDCGVMGPSVYPCRFEGRGSS